MRVVANLAWLVPGGVGGSEEYTLRLLRAVQRLDPPDLELRVLGSRRLHDAAPDLVEPVAGPLHLRPVRVFAESTSIHRRTRNADVVHHFGGRLPARRHGHDVVTIHDLQPLDHPEWFTPLKRHYLAWALPRTARAAAAIATPSRCVADAVIARFDVPADRVRPVPSTWGEPTVPASPSPTPVVVYPAMTHPHKNHAVLFDALDRLQPRHPELRLVLTGGPGRADADVADRAARARVTVERRGRVDRHDLATLVAGATVLAFPSRYEGFGLPVLEALHAGVPVVAADLPVVREVAGDAARYVHPDDVDGWAGAIDELLTDPATRAEMVAAGHRQAALHTPDAAAGRLLELWRGVAAR